MKVLIFGVVLASFASSSWADLANTGNLVKNPEFAALDGSDASTGERMDWSVLSGLHRFPRVDSWTVSESMAQEMEPGKTYLASFGGASDGSYIRQYHTVEEHRLNTDLIDGGFVTFDMSAYIGSSYNDTDRSRIYINFEDGDGLQLQPETILGYYDLNSWSYRELTDLLVPAGTRKFEITIHHDRRAGTGNSTGIALPNVTFSVEDNEASRVALSSMGNLQYDDVPVVFSGALLLTGLMLRRRKA